MNDSQSEQKMEFLLDTGVFMALTKPQVETLLALKEHNRLTAGLIVPFELVSGIPSSDIPDADREFQEQQAALLKYTNLVGSSGTYWETPHYIQKKAFGMKVPEQIDISVQILIKACTECKSISEVEDIINRSHRYATTIPSLSWLRQEANKVSQEFQKSYDEFIRLIGEITRTELPNGGKLSEIERKKFA